MTDDDRDIDIETDEEEEDFDSKQRQGNNTQYYSQAEKRAHHNALERKRRDHIKDSFSSLRDAVPSLRGEKVASRAQILKKSAEYIMFMKRKKLTIQTENEKIRRQNNLLESQIQTLERALQMDTFPMENCDKKQESDMEDCTKSESESSDSEIDNINYSTKINVSGIQH